MPRFYPPKNELSRRFIYFSLVVFLLFILLLGRETFSTEASHVVIPQHDSGRSPTPPSHGTQDASPVPATETPDPIVFSLIMWSKPSATEGALLIKVGLMLSVSVTTTQAPLVNYHVQFTANRHPHHLRRRSRTSYQESVSPSETAIAPRSCVVPQADMARNARPCRTRRIHTNGSFCRTA